MAINLNKVNKPPSQSAPTVQAKKESIWTKDIQLWGNKLSAKQKAELYAETAVLLRAGLDIRKSLELQLQSSKQKIQQSTYQRLLDALLSGSSLAVAMEDTQQFSAYEIAGIRIAEESGQLPPILDRLANHFTKIVKLNQLLVSTLSYPFLVIIVAVGALIFLVTFLVPLFSDIYARLDQELPLATSLIIQLSDWLQSYLGITLLLLIGLIGFFYWQRNQAWLRSWSARLMLAIPVLGPMYQTLQLSKFCHSLGFLLEANIPLVEGMRLSQKMVTFYPIQLSLPKISEEVIKGKAFFVTLGLHKIYPAKLVALARVGEETNQLGPLLSQLGNTYDDEVEQQTKLLGSLIEPVLIVFLAGVIGLVLVAMYLPIFKLVTNFGL